MKKYILNFAVGALAFASLVSCKNEGETEADQVPQAEIEQTSESISTPDASDVETKEMEDTQLVPSGTYTGEAIVVDAEQKEIYVKLNDTTTIELYFSNNTQIVKDGQQADFKSLQEGQTVEVEVEKSGESLKPLKVSIMGDS